jgi:arabinofuranosyltransferase
VLRPPYSAPATRPGPAGAFEALNSNLTISDERLYYTRQSSESHPVTIDDYLHHTSWAQSGAAVRRLAARSRPVLVLRALAKHPTVVPLRAASAPRTVASAENLGLYGYAAGTGVDVIDDHALADDVASHLRLRVRGRPGHEKILSDVWTYARYAAPGAPLPAGITASQVRAARRALGCAPMHRIIVDTDGPWSVGEAPSNMMEAVRSFSFRFDQNPALADREVCGA